MDKELLDLYRKKRAVDGLNGRTWDAENHLKYDKAIELEESCYLTNQADARRSATVLIATERHHDFCDPEGEISNTAGGLYFTERECERKRQEIGKQVIPNTHTRKLAEGRNES